MIEIFAATLGCRRPVPRAGTAGLGLGRVGRLLAALPLASLLPPGAFGVEEPFSPTALVASPDGNQLYVAGATAGAVLVLDVHGVEVRRIAVAPAPSGLALSPDGTQLVVTCAAPQSVVCLIDVAQGRVSARWPAGHTAMAPVFSPDGHTLYVCNRHNGEVLVLDPAGRRPPVRIPVEREPVAAALSRDGGLLLVANHLPAGPANAPVVAAAISVIDTTAQRVVKTLRLPNGSDLVLGIAVSPDGRYAAVSHNLARFYVPTTQLERGWMNTAGLTLIDVARLELINTVLLDNFEAGAANPWAVGWTADGRNLLVTHAGTHELSVIDFPGLVAKLDRLPAVLAPGQTPDYTRAANVKADVPSDLAFLVGLRRRVRLQLNGARALVVAGDTAWVAGYFSDSLNAIDLRARELTPLAVTLGPRVMMTAERRGEMLFNDATICFQHWQSCASCHSWDARVDGLNWDLLNDGIGNPKNAKSLVWAHRTPPAMSLGVRASAEVAVRAGIRHSLFAVLPESVPEALDAYLKSLAPEPSPHLVDGQLAPAAQRGRKVFEDPAVGCFACHPAPLFTDLKSYDVGTAGAADGLGTKFDTPTLVELWRTAPYLHDGSAGTIRDVLTSPEYWGVHGHTSHLTATEIDDLTAYVLSL